MKSATVPFFAALFLLSCQALHDAPETGTVTLQFLSDSAPKTLFPTLPVGTLAPSRYDVSATHSATQETVSRSVDSSTPSVALTLAVGDWDFSVIAYNSSNAKIGGTWRKTVTVTGTGQNLPVVIVADTEGQGSLAFTLDWPAGYALGLSFKPVLAAPGSAQFSPTPMPLDGILSSIPLGAGLWEMTATLRQGAAEASWGIVESVYVFPGQTTQFSRVLLPADLNQAPATPSIQLVYGANAIPADGKLALTGAKLRIVPSSSGALLEYSISSAVSDQTAPAGVTPVIAFAGDLDLSSNGDKVLTVTAHARNAWGTSPSATATFFVSDAVYAKADFAGSGVGTKSNPFKSLVVARDAAGTLVTETSSAIPLRLSSVAAFSLSAPLAIPDGVSLDGGFDGSFAISTAKSSIVSSLTAGGADVSPNATLLLTGGGSFGNELSNIAITGPGGDFGAALEIDGVAATRKISVRNCLVTAGNAAAGSIGVDLRNASLNGTSSFEGNEIFGSASGTETSYSYGMRLSGTTSFAPTLSNNKISGAGGAPANSAGIAVHGGSAVIANATVAGGKASLASSGILIAPSSTVSATRIERNPMISGGIAESTYGIRVAGNQISSLDGLRIWGNRIHGGDGGTSVVNSRGVSCEGTGAGAVWVLSNVIHSGLAAKTLVNTTRYGVFLADTNAEIYNNYISGVGGDTTNEVSALYHSKPGVDDASAMNNILVLTDKGTSPSAYPVIVKEAAGDFGSFKANYLAGSGVTDATCFVRGGVPVLNMAALNSIQDYFGNFNSSPDYTSLHVQVPLVTVFDWSNFDFDNNIKSGTGDLKASAIEIYTPFTMPDFYGVPRDANWSVGPFER